MSSRRKFFLTFVFIIIDVVLLVSFFVVRDAAMLNVLKKEANALSELNMATDRYNKKIKTRGEYKIVESSMKSYLDHDAVLLQDTLLIMKDSKLTSILSYDNYQKDGPEFQESLLYLESTKKDFNEDMDTILSDLEEDSMHDYIYKRIDDSHYCDLFMELMNSDSMKSNYTETKELVGSLKTRMNHILDTSISVLNFLIQNKDDWVLEEGEIRFRNDALYNQYMEYINQLKV